ncbi:MAG: hypothetical protein F6K31_23430 [Symploca sp. SIO2G7]|nr:hypothetical protein [Symploca sp. SIO2G7]
MRRIIRKGNMTAEVVNSLIYLGVYQTVNGVSLDAFVTTTIIDKVIRDETEKYDDYAECIQILKDNGCLNEDSETR